MNFKNYLNEETLNEVLITFGNRPNFGQVVLLAGGAGSGKGFLSGKLLGIEGKVLDVDEIKGKIIAPATPKLNKRIQDIYGIDVTKLDLRNPDNVALLHKINDELGISQKVQDQFFNNVTQDPRKLPNIIFDTTAKSEKKIKQLVGVATAAGYDEKNIHIVWIMNDAAVASKQNKARPRVVPEEILMQTHTGVANNMHQLMKNSRFQEFVDGYVYIVFGKQYIDTTMVFSNTGGSYMDEALILELKRPGKKQIPYSEIATRFLKKIKRYVPKSVRTQWGKF